VNGEAHPRVGLAPFECHKPATTSLLTMSAPTCIRSSVSTQWPLTTACERLTRLSASEPISVALRDGQGYLNLQSWRECGEEAFRGATPPASQCHPGTPRARESRGVTTRSLAERLHEAISEAPRRASRRTKALHLSVRMLVDRSGFEPLTSAVQGRRSPS
jgi:hypothetical protein